MKHTQGPWYTRHGQISSECSTHGCTIANCNRTSAGISDEEVEANANLIAAAPDMLDVLRWWLDQMNDDACDEMGKLVDEMTTKAELAIAKAKGGE